ncbi:MAG: universal stress protein [Sandaracinaceae bacterium]|nr:universal stress protein [Sandaracinaceae bacterium]
MSFTRPILVALPLDHETGDILATARELSRRLAAPLLPVHALGWRPIETDAGRIERTGAVRDQLEAHLAPLLDEGVLVLEPVIERGPPDELVLDVAGSHNAQLIVTGGGGPPTVRRWVIGSVAERIVRGAHVPVWLARGVVPSGAVVLCPVDMSPQSRVGLVAALRMARHFDAKLVVLCVLPESDGFFVDEDVLLSRLEHDEAKARAELERFVAASDPSGVDVELRVTIGKPADRIVEASDEARLIVVASRGFDLLKPGAIGSVIERVLRNSRCSALTLRDLDEGRERRERSLARLAELTGKAREHLDAGAAERALPLLQMAASRAPANAAIQELLAEALEAVGRTEEADGRRKLAAMIRENFA